MYKQRPSKNPQSQDILTLFLRNIPEQSRINEISKFVAPALKGGLFSKPGKILKIDIFTLRDVSSNTTEFHAVIKVDNAAAGRRAIKKLHGRRFKNKSIEAREYIKRDWQNNFGDNPAYAQDDGLFQRRAKDQRRGKKVLAYHEIGDGLMQRAIYTSH